MPDDRAGDTPSQILRHHRLRPRKSLGQNFLQDGRVADRIVEALDLDPGDEVLEIGAGTGVLTDRLAGVARFLAAIELDDSLFSLLAMHFATSPGVRLLHADALEVDPCDIFRGAYKLVGNIPYYVTGPIVRHFLEAACRPRVLVFMVQREVAERMIARPGHLSLLGVSVQFYARAEIVARVPAGAFFPRPKVDSAVVRLLPFERTYETAEVSTFFTVARAGFGTKRKQLVNALGHGLGVSRDTAIALLSDARVASERRAETLTIEEWRRLAAAFGALSTAES
ncbi:MAG: 16S rRNA (adenine(1518)-N(6)/adenine(1519)-N(6)) -dimethyltransferase RsmA [Chloroflexota bacterium]